MHIGSIRPSRFAGRSPGRPTRHRPHAAPSAHVGFALSGALSPGSITCDPATRPERNTMSARTARPALHSQRTGASRARFSLRALSGCGAAAALILIPATGAAAATAAPAPAANVGLFGSQDPTYDAVYRQ